MDDVTRPPVRGRPKDLAKRDAILDAARRLFLEHGPASVPMDQLAAAAGVAKATLYANFRDKPALIVDLIRRESERIVTDDFAAELRGRAIEEALTTFGERLLRFLADPEMMAMERLISSSAASAPHAAQQFFEAGPGRAMDILREVMREGHEAGVLDTPDLMAASADLVGLWQGFVRVELTFRLRQALEEGELRSRAAHGVAQFMRLYGRSALLET